MIGVLDSGIGGLRLCRNLRQRWPQEDFLFLADQAHVPYGSLSRQRLLDILNANLLWMKGQGVQRVVIACNTASASGILQQPLSGLEVQGIITATCAQAAGLRRILVLATPFTAQSHCYRDELRRISPQSEVKEVGLRQLASLIERMADSEEITAYLQQEIGRFAGRFDAAILACTHFPYVRPQFEQILHLQLIDSESIVPDWQPQIEHGALRIVTTGNAAYLQRQMLQMLDWRWPCESVQIEKE